MAGVDGDGPQAIPHHGHRRHHRRHSWPHLARHKGTMNMSDLPDKEPPRFWVAFGILCITFALSVVMSVYLIVRAEAQEQPLCGPAEILLRQFSEIHKEKPVWEGVVPQDTGPVEVLLLQSAKSTWTLFTIRGGIACIIASGRDG